MISEENELFIRNCMKLNDELESGKTPSQDISMALIKEMQMCAIRLNTADSA